MEWVWILGAIWVLLAIGIALLIGRSIRLADRKAARAHGVPRERPNFVVDERPLHVLPPPAPPSPAEPPPAAPPPARSAGRDAPTVPGIPSARPAVGHSPVPRSRRPRPRRSGMG
jgi:hypothetical protein